LQGVKGSSPLSRIIWRISMIGKNDINKIKNIFYTFSHAQNYALADQVLANTPVQSLSQEAMIAYMQSTMDNKDKYKSREKFITDCRNEILKRNEKLDRKFERSI
jgi:hypothetical protein